MSNIITEDALLSAIWYRFKQDTELENIMCGSIELGNGWVDENTPFPYLNHRLDVDVTDDFFILNSDYILDFWDYNQSKTRILEMVGRVRAKLNRAVIGFIPYEDTFFVQPTQPTDYEYFLDHMEVSQPWRGDEKTPKAIIGRIYFDNGDFIPEEQREIWHYASTWTIRSTMTVQELKDLGL